MDSKTQAMWILRVAVALEFAGHGILAFSQKASWLSFFTPFGIGPEAGGVIMQVVGVLDMSLAVLLLVKPVPAAVLWMALWGMWTALLRPISGESIVEWIERGPNWGAPLALLVLMGLPKRPRDLLSSSVSASPHSGGRQNHALASTQSDCG
jgi:hypothetical protein